MTAGDDVKSSEPILALRDAQVTFPLRGGNVLRAFHGVDLVLGKGEIVGLIGESGSGKSTLARALMGLATMSKGQLFWQGKQFATGKGEMRALHGRMQMVFQDPHSALNPRMRIARSVMEPLVVLGMGEAREREKRAVEMLERVGLSSDFASRYPHQLSGGQKQRVNIARALITSPEVIICDESVASLDVALQAEILNLLLDLRRDLGLTILFVSHDLSVVNHISDRIYVMYLGQIVEVASAASLEQRPAHPYSEALISSQPQAVPRTGARSGKELLKGEVPSPVRPPSGCKFHPRCRHAIDLCKTDEPRLKQTGFGPVAACHRAEELSLAGFRTFAQEEAAT